MSKKSITLSVDKDIDEFFENFRTKTLIIQDQEIRMTKTKTELYTDAIRYAMQNADKWLFDKNED